MLHIIFLEPRIPGNTGNTIRLSACTGCMLHLVEPLSFSMDNARLRRAGLDYHLMAHVQVHANLDEALDTVPGNVWAFTGHASHSFTDVSYAQDDGLLFGSEDTGLPDYALYHQRVTQRLRIPMIPGARSLNLAVSASLGVYHALYQLSYPGLV